MLFGNRHFVTFGLNLHSDVLSRCVDQSPSVLVAATSSDSDTEDEALQSNNSRYDNQTPPCTGNQLARVRTL